MAALTSMTILAAPAPAVISLGDQRVGDCISQVSFLNPPPAKAPPILNLSPPEIPLLSPPESSPGSSRRLLPPFRRATPHFGPLRGLFARPRNWSIPPRGSSRPLLMLFAPLPRLCFGRGAGVEGVTLSSFPRPVCVARRRQPAEGLTGRSTSPQGSE